MWKLVSQTCWLCLNSDRDIVLFVAAKLGGTRLIDNLQVAFTPQ